MKGMKKKIIMMKDVVEVFSKENGEKNQEQVLATLL